MRYDGVVEFPTRSDPVDHQLRSSGPLDPISWEIGAQLKLGVGGGEKLVGG